MATKFKQDIDVTGTVNATSFSGDGSSLTGVSGGASTLGALTDVSTTGVTNGQILKYNGSSWAPASDETGSSGSGDIDGVVAGTGLTGGGTSGTVTLNADIGTTANKLVQLNGDAKLPAVDGSQLLNISTATNINGLSDVDTATSPPSTGQVLKWDGAKWAPGNDLQASGGALGDITITGSTLASSGATITLDDNVTVTGTFTSSQAGSPVLTSASTLTLQATTRTTIANTPLKLHSFTTTQRDALTASTGDLIYNTTTSKFQGFGDGSWVDLH